MQPGKDSEYSEGVAIDFVVALTWLKGEQEVGDAGLWGLRFRRVSKATT